MKAKELLYFHFEQDQEENWHFHEIDLLNRIMQSRTLYQLVYFYAPLSSCTFSMAGA